MDRGKASWFGWVVSGLWALVIVSLFAGPDIVLTVVPTLLAYMLGFAVLAIVAGVLAVLLWLAGRDAIDEIKFARERDRPWLWRCVGLLGLVGLVVDGGAGAWSAYRHQILFSAAVEEMPLAGIPLLMTLASYPLKWLEHLWSHPKGALDGD